ncbi:MAG: cell envelope integrity protein CreD [Verrucomicrobiia bacterium]
MNTPDHVSLPDHLKSSSTLIKIAGVAVLILLLLVPLQMVRSVLRERLSRRNEAVASITSSWGRDQKLIGPVLVVPYQRAVKSWKERPNATGAIERFEAVDLIQATAYFLPTNLVVAGHLTPSKLHRGIYEAVVFRGELDISGQFAQPDFASLRIDEKSVLWNEALVAFAIPDLRGVKETLQMAWGRGSHPLLPGSKLKGFSSGVFTRVGDPRNLGASIPFRLRLALNGSGGMSIAPVGAQNQVRITSPWPDPSFVGAILPAQRQVSRNGFDASWQVSYYSREYGQQWTDQEPEAGLHPASADSSLFGVLLLSGIDAYRNTERAIKYGVLFIVLIFAAFFLFEILAALKIHPFQYAVVGAALCLFYLALLSLSEFISFGLSYLIAVAVTILLICFHSAKMLKSGTRTLIVAALLAAIYAFLYVALQLQDYALLLGTAGLFAILALVIVLTRNTDWYARDRA